MSTFHGPYPGRKDPRTRTKGALAENRRQKRLDAEQRDAELPQDSPKRKRNKPLDITAEGVV